MRPIFFLLFSILLASVSASANAPKESDSIRDSEILSPKQRRARAQREAFNKKIMSMSYGDLESSAKKNKKMAKVLRRLKKKGINNAAHYEQFKARKKGQMGRQMYPRSWKRAGKNRDDIYQRHSQDIQ